MNFLIVLKMSRTPTTTQEEKNKLNQELQNAPKPNRTRPKRSEGSLLKPRRLRFEEAAAPIKKYWQGFVEEREYLASCNCYVAQEPCRTEPCTCDRRGEVKLENGEIELTCTCPIECKPLQSAQEMF